MLGVSRFRLAVLLSLFLSALPVSSPAEDGDEATSPEGVAPTRLAVLACERMQELGYGDLLTARLSAMPLGRLELVERELLDTIGGEFQLASLLGAENAVPQRMALGKLLRADTLLLLSFVDNDTADDQTAARSIRLVMVDTRTGARLTRDGLSDSADMDKATDEVVRRVGETLRRYPNGAKQIVGVSPFLSRCLTHAYDCYQTSCAELLSQVLLQRPGVAVLEIEEARAISAELALTSPDEKDAQLPGGGNALEHRVVPVLVSGEFLASRQGAAGSEADRFEVTVNLQRRGRSETVRAADLDRERLVAFLSATLPDKILGDALSGATPGGPIGADAQLQWLVAEADRFTRIGMWEQASKLHEAALLLRPEDTDLRFHLIDAYHRRMMCQLPVPERSEGLPSVEAIRRQFQERTKLYPFILAHLEYILRNRQVSAEVFVQRSRTNRIEWGGMRQSYCSYKIDSLAQSIPYPTRFKDFPVSGGGNDWRCYQKIGEEEIERCLPMQDEFMTNVFPLIRELPSKYDKAELGLRLGLSFPHSMRQSRRPQGSAFSKQARETSQEKSKLAGPPPRSALPPPRSSGERRAREMADRMQQMMDEARRQPGVRPPSSAPSSEKPDLSESVARMRERVRERRKLQPKPPPPTVVQDGKWPKYERTRPLPLTIKTLDGQSRAVEGDWLQLHERWGPAYHWPKAVTHYPIVNWRACTPTLDVLWSDWAVLVMRTKGLAEEILARPDAVFLDVLWDGRDFWVVTKLAGVWIVSTSGEILRTIGADQGLPPYDQAEVLHPVAEGKALMAGSFGENHRAWCAMIDTGKEKPVEILHEATTVYSALSTPYDETLSRAFCPTFIHEYRSAGKTPDYYIVGREISGGPLLVNRETLEVSEVPRHVGSKLPQHEFGLKREFLNPRGLFCNRHSRDFLLFSEGGTMVIPSRSDFLNEDPRTSGFPSSAWGPGVTVWSSPLDPSDPAEPFSRRWYECSYSYYAVLPVGKWLYLPADMTWYRLERETFREETVSPLRPWENTGARPTLRTSSHYGIVFTHSYGYTYRPFAQIKILEGP